MGVRLGIDLGTTYACVSYVDEQGVTRMIDPVEGGGNKTPAVVYFDPVTNDVAVGGAAKEEGALHPECMAMYARQQLDYPTFSFSINGTAYSSAEIISILLQKLIRDAEACFPGEEIEGAVITCPAYFGAVGCAAILTACENVVMRSGKKLRVLQIINEPAAIALAYAHSNPGDIQKNILIYDLGGSSFDVTLMKLDFVGADRKTQILAIDGNRLLGGKDWDSVLADYVRNKFCEETGADPDEILSDAEQIQWYSERIEKAKRALTHKAATRLTPFFNSKKATIEITREIFEAETESLLNETIRVIDGMLARKGLSMANDIDEIILVGGASQMPRVKNRLMMEYNKPITSYEPDTIIARGAALAAQGVDGDVVTAESPGNDVESAVPSRLCADSAG